MFMELKIPSVRIVKCDSFSILSAMLEKTNKACDIVICSYAVTEVWMKRLWGLKMSGKVKKITMLLDFDVMSRHREKLLTLQELCDRLYLISSHAKLLLVESEDFSAVAVMSCNATQNYRIETYYVTNREREIENIRGDLAGIFRESIKIT